RPPRRGRARSSGDAEAGGSGANFLRVGALEVNIARGARRTLAMQVVELLAPGRVCDGARVPIEQLPPSGCCLIAGHPGPFVQVAALDQNETPNMALGDRAPECRFHRLPHTGTKPYRRNAPIPRAFERTSHFARCGAALRQIER